MLLNEIAKVVDIASRRKKKKHHEEDDYDDEIPDTIGAPKADELTNKRRAKLSPADQLRDFSRQLGKKPKK